MNINKKDVALKMSHFLSLITVMCLKKSFLFVVDGSRSMEFSKSFVLDKAFTKPYLNASFLMFSNKTKLYNFYPVNLKAKGNTNIKKLFKYLNKNISPNTVIIFVTDALFTSNRWEKEYLKLLKNKNYQSCYKYAIGTNLFSYDQEESLTLLSLNPNNTFHVVCSNQLDELIQKIVTENQK